MNEDNKEEKNNFTNVKNQDKNNYDQYFDTEIKENNSNQENHRPRSEINNTHFDKVII